ncbi:trypsin-like serine protease [Kitasatospora sp. RG8]|uniref:trypsin-like serine protease n=1 Tax=Kitasatospora sp. RG8 TaxID=2820815 RepID=UPI001ADFB892|nr:trypsin-like serine protease [Kitasatospora sp. RG8]MBP0450581.1 trypsin-like serine protease [Kitasatospora sp. RG8]
MRTSRNRRLLAGLMGLAAAGLGTAAPTAIADTVTTANSAAPQIVEDFAYPGAAQVLADKGITLTSGDGHIILTDDCNTAQIKVWSRLPTANVGQFCFNSTAPHGFLAMSIAEVVGLQTLAQPLTATVSADGRTDTVSLDKGDIKGVGEGAKGSRSVLLQLRVDSPTAPTTPPAAVTDALYTARIDVGDGKRACSGALVDRYWVMTAASCFADDPTKPTTPAAGAPKLHTTATVGRPDLTATDTGVTTDILELVPRQDRDLVMARLATPADGISPVALAAAAPASGEPLRAIGYGRTPSLWAPTTLHAAAVAAGATDATGVDLAWQDATTTVCAGDAGAPATRTANGQPQLVAVTSRAWQSGCFNTTETRTGAYGARVDDLSTWVQQVKASRPGSRLFAVGGDQKIWTNEGSYSTNVWGTFAEVPDTSGIRQVSAVTMGDKVRLFAIGGDNTIWTVTKNTTTGAWSTPEQVPGNSGMQQVSAVAMGDKVRLFAIGGDQKIWTAAGDSTAGTWSPFEALPGGGVKQVSVTAVGNTVRVFALGSDQQIWTTTGDYTAGTWSTFAAIPSSGIQHIAATTVGNLVRLFAVGSDQKIWTTDSTNNGPWTTFDQVPNVSGGINQVAATTIGDTVRLFALSSEQQIWTADKKADGSWTTFYGLTSNAVQSITTTPAG